MTPWFPCFKNLFFQLSYSGGISQQKPVLLFLANVYISDKTFFLGKRPKNWFNFLTA